MGRNISAIAEIADPHLDTLIDREKVEDFSVQELEDQLSFMKKGKATDQIGLVMEMLQLVSGNLLESITGLFNDVFCFCGVPIAWKKSQFLFLCKKGVPTIPATSRPITFLPILFKFF